MPIFDQTYKPWEAHYGHKSRWLTVAKQELRVANSTPLFRRLLLFSLLPFMLFVFMLLVVNLMTTSPSELIRSAVREIHYANVDARFFRLYLWMTSPFAFIFCLFLGSNSICLDYRNNLLEVYFAKPLTRWDYFTGKLAAVCFIPMTLMAGLCLVLIALHVVLSPTNGLLFLQENWWLPFAVLAWSLCVVLPFALIMMASSAMTKSSAAASIIAFAMITVNTAFGNALAELTRRPNVRCLSMTRCMMHLSDLIWGVETRITLPWSYMVAVLLTVCLVSGYLIVSRVRAVEITS